jgi:3-hydroxybutyryl-CoA dehydrogenase
MRLPHTLIERAPTHQEHPQAMTISDIKKVGVIGAGQMGNGIAHVCALAGWMWFCTTSQGRPSKPGLATINGNMARQAPRTSPKKNARPALARIRRSEFEQFMADCDLVIESRSKTKRSSARSFRALPGGEAGTILATNTSSISITRLAASTDRPEKFIGIHFMNPVPLMELVELSAASPPTTRP